MKTIIEELQSRGLLKQVTNEEKVIKAQNLNKALYCGFDPTADSLHVGHLIQIINLKRFQQYGFKPIAILGGGTGMIGDPSFKAAERKLLTLEDLNSNINSIKKQLESLIGDVSIINNGDWLNDMTLIDFLRIIGKDFNLSYLLAKENIATRISTGLSVTEFSYTMLQAYDFYKLYTDYDCHVQIGGSDQWGNITSGIDYISSKLGNANSEACGVTMNLLTKKDGTKFGKTESGAVWLDSTKTSEYEFYQFFFNQTDEECHKLLNFLSLLSVEQISKIVEEHKKEPAKRIMQKNLAESVTLFVHKEDGLKKAQLITDALFNGNILHLSVEELRQTFNSLPYAEIQKELNILEFLVQNQIVSSNREAREFIENKAISINDKIVESNELIVTKDLLIHNSIFIVKKGKKKYFIVEWK